MDRIPSLADVRPGDICITRMGGLIPGTFPVRIGTALLKESYHVGPFSADHVLICVEAPRTVPPFELPRTERADWIDGHRVEPGRAVQAMPGGAEEIALTPAKHWSNTVRWFRLQEDYAGQAEDAAAIARLFVSERVPYSFLSYLALAAWSRGLKAARLERWIDRRSESVPIWGADDPHYALPAEAICSVLVDQCWSLAGKRVIEGVARQCVTPGMLAGQLSEREGVIQGRPS